MAPSVIFGQIYVFGSTAEKGPAQKQSGVWHVGRRRRTFGIEPEYMRGFNAFVGEMKYCCQFLVGEHRILLAKEIAYRKVAVNKIIHEK